MKPSTRSSPIAITQKIVYDNYMTVRSNLAFLKAWIDDRLADIESGKTPNPEKTFAWYWLKNAGDGEYFAHKDVVFEVFHNFVALSQWGNSLYNIMLRLATDTGDPDTRAWFKKTMASNPDDAAGDAFTPLERFVMELFRTISPNGGSISAMEEVRTPPYQRHGYVVSPHTSTSMDPVHWKDPEKFNPDRYKNAPTSHDINEEKCEQIGFAKCPFSSEPSMSRTGARRRSTIAGSAPYTASSTVSRCRSATTRALRHSASAIAAAPASNSPSRCSKTFYERYGRAKSSFRSLTSPTPNRFPSDQRPLSGTTLVYPPDLAVLQTP